MKYKVNDRVRIKSLDWYNENKDELGNMDCGDALMTTEKSKFCGKIVIISNASDVINGYKIKEDNGCYNWTDEMIEGIVEEENKPKFKVGDRVKIKSLDWYNNNINAFGNVCFYDTPCFIRSMKKYCDKVMTITEITNGMYRMKEDNSMFCWTDKMIECLVKEETISDKVIEEVKTYGDSIKTAWICPDGYVFKDKNGNIINATKIVLEKKDEYSKTDDIIKWLRECDMTKYIGVIYSGMCSITFDTEKLIKDIIEMMGDE